MKKIHLLLVLCALLLTGCSSQELDGLGIVTSMELGKEKDLWTARAELVQFSDPDAEPGQSTRILVSSDSDLSRCIEEFKETEGLPLYLGHLRLIILHPELMEEQDSASLRELCAYCLSNPQIRFNTVLAAADSQEPVLNGLESTPENIGIDLSRRFRTFGTNAELSDLINWLHKAGPVPELPILETRDVNEQPVTAIRSQEQYLPVTGRKEIKP